MFLILQKVWIGIYVKDANITNEGKIKVTNTNTLGFGIIASTADVTNKGEITLENSLNPTKPNIGMYTVDSNPLKNMGKITVGKNGIGIYGKNFSNGDSATLPNSTIEVWRKWNRSFIQQMETVILNLEV